MELRRVVVTGMGAVTPLGCGVEATWANILAGKSGAQRIDDFQVDDIACQIAHRVPLGDFAEGKFNADEWMDVKDQRKVDPFFIPGRLMNLASGYVSIRFGLKGPNHSVVTARSTGAHAIGDSWRLIAMGDADVMVAGGAEGAGKR